MLSGKIYTQVERVVDRLSEVDIENNLWDYDSLVETLEKLQQTYNTQKGIEFFLDTERGVPCEGAKQE